jgi:hypothetical protein
MAKLSRESLEFAKAHIKKFYDSDFFPKPFEFEALWANWDEVVTHLTCNDVNGYTIVGPHGKTWQHLRIIPGASKCIAS